MESHSAAWDLDVLDDGWTAISATSLTAKTAPDAAESIQDRIVRVTADEGVLKDFYNVETSPTRHARLDAFYETELAALAQQPFDAYATRDEQADHLLLRNYLTRTQRTLARDRARDAAFADFVEPFAAPVRTWLERRQRVEPLDPQALADSFDETIGIVARTRDYVEEHAGRYSRSAGWRGARAVRNLRDHLEEFHAFYAGYDPLFDWWVEEPYQRLHAALGRIADVIAEKIAGLRPGDDEDDAIVGEPIGRAGLLAELEAEMVPYSPSELVAIGEAEYAWCEAEMIKAAADLGFGTRWRDALEHVKNLYEPPGAQPTFIKALVDEGAAYVQQHDLVTVPRLAAEGVRMTMISAARQRINPFFLGGTRLQVSYPTAAMPHAAKGMALRGNNRHFARATAFHEMIPGHHLQLHVGARKRPYRARLFTTPFFVEGWALYWEMLLWARGDFFVSAEDRVGALFWRMHRCARVVFSLRFHLGEMSADECVDMLVDRVGHERSNAEGEVRRSLAGDYSPLYQAGYLLGALQLVRLREEVLGQQRMGEKEFHDAVLAANEMPIEMLRALLLEKELSRDFKSEWRFYDDAEGGLTKHVNMSMRSGR